MSEELSHVNKFASVCYQFQGPGIGAGETALTFFENLSGTRIKPETRCLDIGFGDAKLLGALQKRGCDALYGVDIAEAAIKRIGEEVAQPERIQTHLLDVSHEVLPLPDDCIDVAFCTESIEHMSNPYFMVAEVKRVIKHGGFFCIAFPQPEDNLGYGGGQHAHVYPGFLQRESFERFMLQLYFKLVSRMANGSSAWYVFRNYKGEGIVDVFEIISGNYTEDRLFSCMENF